MTYFSKFKLQQATKTLKSGGLIAYPTEAVYGLGCDPLNKSAVLKLLTLKKRPIDKGLILIAANFEQLAPYLLYDAEMLTKILPTWKLKDVAITWIIPSQPWVPQYLTGKHQSLAVRVTNHPLSKALCEDFNAPIVSTSANPNKKKSASNALQVQNYFHKYNIHIIHGLTGENKQESMIYDAVSGNKLR